MKNKKQFAFLGMLWCAFWMVSCDSNRSDGTEVVIISMNDIHGTFDYLPKLSAFVKETKAANPNVIVVNAGDRFTGNPYNDYYNEPGLPIIDLENRIGVDVSTIGNHEFDYGQKLLNERIKQSNAIEISANMELKGSTLDVIEPYYSIEKDGLNIVFLGLINRNPKTHRPDVMKNKVDS
ncbi:MAG: metallophosphoesterase, partial [Bacteroidales bacterium]|nr:metallophosphoesterase [Bacteroidales bacterium]